MTGTIEGSFLPLSLNKKPRLLTRVNHFRLSPRDPRLVCGPYLYDPELPEYAVGFKSALLQRLPYDTTGNARH